MAIVQPGEGWGAAINTLADNEILYLAPGNHGSRAIFQKGQVNVPFIPKRTGQRAVAD